MQHSLSLNLTEEIVRVVLIIFLFSVGKPLNFQYGSGSVSRYLGQYHVIARDLVVKYQVSSMFLLFVLKIG